MVNEATVYNTRTVYDKTDGGGAYEYYDEIVKIGNYDYRAVKVGNKLWLKDYFLEQIGTYSVGLGGVLYTFNSVMDNNGQLNSSMLSLSGIDNWRVPNTSDFSELSSLVSEGNPSISGEYLRSKYQWFNNPVSKAKKFSYPPIGYYQSSVTGVTQFASFWTSSVIGSTDAYSRNLSYNDSGIGGSLGTNKNFRFGVILVKDL